MDKVFIKNLLLRGIIGVNPSERNTEQDILVNVTVFTDTHPAAQADDIADCVDYSILTKRIRQLVENAKRFTVEALAEDIAALCLDTPKAVKATVKVEKPGAVSGSESVGVEIQRERL